MKLNLTGKISLFVGILVIAMALILGLVAINMSADSLLEQQSELTLNYAKEGAGHIKALLDTRLHVLDEIAKKDEVSSMNWEMQRPILAADAERLEYLDMAVVSLDGAARYVLSDEETNLGDRTYFLKAAQGESNISDVLISRVTGEPVFMYAVPIHDANHDQVLGVLVARRDASALSSVTDQIGSGERGYAFVIGKNGTFFAHPNRELVLQQRNAITDIEEDGSLKNFGLALQELGIGNTGMANYEFEGDNRITAMMPIEGTDWILGVGNYESDVMQRATALKTAMMLIGLAVIIGGLAGAFFVGRLISKPIKNLRGIADRIAIGDVDVDVSTNLKDEVGELMVSFGKMADNIKEQSFGIQRLAEGDLTLEIAPKSEKDVMSHSMISMTGTLKDLVSEAEMLTRAAVDGELTTRGNEERFNGGYREIISGMNSTLDAIKTPLDVAKEFIINMANGTQSEYIPDAEQYKGYYGELILNLNSVLETLMNMLSEITQLTEEAINGNLSHRADVSKMKGGYIDMVDGVNAIVENLVNPLNLVAGYVEQIGRGEIPTKITDEYKGDFDNIKISINSCIDGLKGLEEGNHILGKLSVNDYTEKVEGAYQGIYAEIAESINVVRGRVYDIQGMANAVSVGDLSMIEQLRQMGKQSENDELVPALTLMMENIISLVDETKLLAESAIEGRMDVRGDTSKFKGEFAKVIEGINSTLDAVIAPVEEALQVLKEMAEGNLRVSVQGDYKGGHAEIKNALNETLANLLRYVDEISSVLAEIGNGNLNLSVTADYKGDFVTIKDSLNNIIITLSQVMGDINEAADQVASGSRQVSDGSQALSQGSTEQASAIQELTASIAEVASQTKDNALNAGEASQLAEGARDNAVSGNSQMQGMLESMAAINESSANISKIIKVIDDIAFQTNILALNAAVEAARAGQHGKGFAVVAEEVRNLAARSAEAARNTTDLIEGSINKVEAGTKIANETAAALEQIVGDIEKAADLVANIASASNQQASGIAQINKGIEQVSQVVQNNSATAEQSAASSEELSSQAELLKEMVGRFKLNAASLGLPGFDRNLLEISHGTPIKIDLRDEFDKY